MKKSQEILNRFAFCSQLEIERESDRGFMARCPAHDDNKASLAVDLADSGHLLINCHANCTIDAIVSALGVKLKDLMPPQPPSTKPRVIAAYDYHDADGTLRYQAVRMEPKDFRQRQPDGKGGWKWSVKGVALVPYRLPQLLAADPVETVFIVEGEKDADRLASLGLVATCNVGGAGKWKSTYAEHLAGRNVVILPDNDEPGEHHAEQVAKSLDGKAASVKILALPDLPTKGDVSDWLDAGGTVDRLRELVAGAGDWKPSTATATATANTTTTATPVAFAIGDRVSPSDRSNIGTVEAEHGDGTFDVRFVSKDGVEAVKRFPAAELRLPGQVVATTNATPNIRTLGDVESSEINWLWDSWLARGMVSILDADPGSGKSTFTLDLASRISCGYGMPPYGGQSGKPAGTLLLSAEDSLSATIRPRLEANGATLSNVHALETVEAGGVRRPPVIPEDLPMLAEICRDKNVALVVIDPFFSYLSDEYDSHKDHDVRRVMHHVAEFATKANVCVLLVRHLNKMAGPAAIYRGGGSIGIIGACRTAMVVGPHPDEPDRRILAVSKSNLAPLPKSLIFRLTPAGSVARVDWMGESDLTADDIITAPRRGRPKADAKEWLTDLLADGPMDVEAIQEQASATGKSWRTVRRAKKDLEIVHFKDGFAGGWKWSLPGYETNDAGTDAAHEVGHFSQSSIVANFDVGHVENSGQLRSRPVQGSGQDRSWPTESGSGSGQLRENGADAAPRQFEDI